jgi:biotin carboxyl carrier protein
MTRQFTITLEGTDYPVAADGNTITVNGRPFIVEVTDDGAVLVDGIAYDVALEGTVVVMMDQSYPFQVSGLTLGAAAAQAPAQPATAPTAEAGAGAVLAIMPGKIVRVLVEPGQTVEEGQAVCVLEAMKMENELQARQSGTVRAVHVQPGADVEKDQLLVEIE